MKKILSIVIVMLFIVAITVVGTACKPAAVETTEAETQTEAEETTAAVTEEEDEEEAVVVAEEEQLYVEVSALNSLEYFFDHKLGMELAGKELGVTTEYTGPADYDMNAVIEAMEIAVAKGANVIWGYNCCDTMTASHWTDYYNDTEEQDKAILEYCRMYYWG